MPVEFVDGEAVLVEEIVAKWEEYDLVNQIARDGKKLSDTPIFIDEGVGDTMVLPEVPNIDLIATALDAQGISYVYDRFPGDHASHLRYQLASAFSFLSPHIGATPIEDFSNVFFTDLTQGLNMISLPLKPRTPYTARSLAEALGATAVIEYDEARGRFVGFTPESSGDGFPIEGGKGYIVNVLEGKTHTFTGATWINEPSVEAAPTLDTGSAWAFVVSGTLGHPTTQAEASYSEGYAVQVRNLRTGAIITGVVSKSGYFALASADLSRRSIIQTGDELEIIARDASGNVVSKVIRAIDADNIGKAYLNVPLRFGEIIPSQTALLQNYPNPFNPETWIPYTLSTSADVTLRIYDARGQLIRTFAIEHCNAGEYIKPGKAMYWDGRNERGEFVASGVYFYTFQSGSFTASRKMVILK